MTCGAPSTKRSSTRSYVRFGCAATAPAVRDDRERPGREIHAWCLSPLTPRGVVNTRVGLCPRGCGVAVGLRAGAGGAGRSGRASRGERVRPGRCVRPQCRPRARRAWSREVINRGGHVARVQTRICRQNAWRRWLSSSAEICAREPMYEVACSACRVHGDTGALVAFFSLVISARRDPAALERRGRSDRVV